MMLYLTHGNGEESIPLELPASPSQVEEIDIRLDDICSGEGNFRISDVKSSVMGLWQFIRNEDLLNPEELEKLNRLSRHIDVMSEKDRQIFAGTLLSEPVSSLDDVLRTVGRIGQYEIIPEVTCDRELGGYLVEHGRIDCPEHLKPYLDYIGIGAEFYSDYGGTYTLDGYVVQKRRMPIRTQSPEPWRNESRDEMLRLTLQVRGKSDYTLVLPADEEYLTDIKKYLGIDDFTQAQIRDVRFKVSYVGWAANAMDCASVESYNEFAVELEDIWQKESVLLFYASVLIVEKPDTLQQARELLQNLNNYEYITEGTYEYGRRRFQEKLGLDDECIEKLEGYMDFEQYGMDCMEQDGVIETEFGLLRRINPPFPNRRQELRMKGF